MITNIIFIVICTILFPTLLGYKKNTEEWVKGFIFILAGAFFLASCIFLFIFPSEMMRWAMGIIGISIIAAFIIGRAILRF